VTEQRRVSVRCHKCPEVVSLGEQAEVVIEAGRGLSRARFEMAVDARARLPLGATVELGKDRYRVVGLTRGLVASGGDPLAFLHLRDSQNLQFKLAPPVARRAPAAGTSGGSNHTVNAVIARLHPGADADSAAETIRPAQASRGAGQCQGGGDSDAPGRAAPACSSACSPACFCSSLR
jgi:hypothetical protein